MNLNVPDKRWVMLPEYGYSREEMPESPTVHHFDSSNEAEVITKLIQRDIGTEQVKNKRVCFDITGFMRPHILFIVKYFQSIGVRRFDVIYTEPERYGRKEATTFSNDVISVRQVAGFEGVHKDDVAHDILVIGVGYDDALISRVANEKDSAKQIQLLSLPSLSADMYQESILRLDKTALADGAHSEDRLFFAPANDPFVIANELSTMMTRLKSRGPIDNIYLTPLATKPQALGFAIFFLGEMTNEPASILFPFSRSYSRETSSGVGRTWVYEVSV